MWVFCCGHYRSGSTLQYQITAEIVEALAVGKRLGYVTNENFDLLKKNHTTKRVFLVVKGHDFIKDGAELIRKGEAKAIYVYRDLRDMVVSLMNQLEGRSFSSVLMDGYIEFTINVYHKWVSSGEMFISKYEDMILNRKQEALRIAHYLGLKISDSLASKIADKLSISNQKKIIKQIDYESIYNKYDRNDAPDPHTMLKVDTINSGAAGQWEKRLSPFQIAMVEAVAYDWLVRRGYRISQAWWRRQVALVTYLFFLKTPRILKLAVVRFLRYLNDFRRFCFVKD